MKKLLVISDSHGNHAMIHRVVEQERPFDYLVHCGDIEGKMQDILAPEPFGVYCVCGNCDSYGSYPAELTFDAEGHRIFITHGHRYGVHGGSALLAAAAVARGADIALYGHTHRPEISYNEENGVFIINPGSIALPRTGSPKGNYAVITLEEGQKPITEIRKIRIGR